MKISTRNADHYQWGEGKPFGESWRLMTHADLSILQESMPPGAAETRHRHRRTRQFFYVLSGTLVLEIDREEHHLRAGEGIEVPPGAPHQVRSLPSAETPVEFLVVSHPGNSRDDRMPPTDEVPATPVDIP